ncbi:uncharacterized protein PHACADRAFT_193593 [Phanerochaete carnosa HHB-10118-sp]|uniref:Uncharacterized protein n=1 Tax=Phanerochaete carnosa (strain HHB-10118-sp) TaxID=650164 RepID=K5WGM6_PHACS|nr:uncharacterized protein PHACADRAFT_193593 [Phanerochaete carnosa HHB-10118-sp]EKM58475.1 hypothetical protein PHACADRAFT_193593 [Phanerochaete carnosa HHB-10118-sp]
MRWLFLLAVTLAVFARAQNDGIGDSLNISFQVTSGGNDNYFLRDNVTAAQLLLTSASNASTVLRRLVVALPAGNSGALTYFLPINATDNTTSLSISLVNDTLHSTTREFNNAGIEVDFIFSSNASLGVTIIGAVRAMRDYVEGNGTMHDIFNYTLDSYNSSFVRLHRKWINTTLGDPPGTFRGADLYLSIPSNSSAQFSVTNNTWAPTVDILVPAGPSSGIVRIAVVTNETSLAGLKPQSLFLANATSGNEGLQTTLQGLANGSSEPAKQVSFLTYTDKFTAGGWRFLTYFGRDSMIALRLLMPTLTSEAIESVLGAVIERANSTGALCHEETIGDYASFINIQDNQSHLGNQPFYDYKMIDTDLLLLPAMAHYFLELPQGQGRAKQFLARNATLQNGTYAEILTRTVLYNYARALPFAQNATYGNLLGLRPGQPVGDWRDSNQGLGYGFYPFDVNTALVPSSLRATQALLDASVLSNTSLNATEVGDIAGVWEGHTPKLFEVRVDASTAQQRLEDFVVRANLSKSLLNQTGSSARGNEVAFYALSLKMDGTPVEVLNSDMSFNLVYGSNVSQVFLQHAVDALQPYPKGLLTNIGMVVSNPAYDSNRTNIDVLNRAAYHGTVIWSFQQGLMASGLARQLSLCIATNEVPTAHFALALSEPPAWCADDAFVQSLKDAQSRLWTAIEGACSEINTEVWSYSFNNESNTFEVADLASLSPDGTESDAIQLWSYGFLGIIDPHGNRTIDS